MHPLRFGQLNRPEKRVELLGLNEKNGALETAWPRAPLLRAA
ncbi:hypothetical protein [Hymenobacter volaticus]|nr:hypothetical protein [Hymenobacter volaticus]